MIDFLKLTVGLAVCAAFLVAIPVFAYIFGGGLALLGLYYLINEYQEEERRNAEDRTD